MSDNPLVCADMLYSNSWSRKPVMNPRESIYTFQWLSESMLALVAWIIGSWACGGLRTH